MQILVVEDDKTKRENVEFFLESRKIEYHTCEYVNQALKYIIRNKNEISGVILDLGLYLFDNGDYDRYNGLEILAEMQRKKINIPVLINSTTEVGMIDEEYPFVWGQRTRIYNDDFLKKFVTFLRERKEQ